MIVLMGKKENREREKFPRQFSYCGSWNPFTRFVLPVTRYLRFRNVRRFDLVKSHTFIFGLNQAFCFVRKARLERNGNGEMK